MFANLNYLLLIVLIILKKQLVDAQESHEQASYEEMDPDSREEQSHASKNREYDPLAGKPSSNTAADDESSYENQMPQQATKTEKEPNVHHNHHQENPAYPHPLLNPYLTFGPVGPYANQENPLFRQMPFLPMQAQTSYGSYDQLSGYPTFHQPPIFNPLLYPPVMYGQQQPHFPFANQPPMINQGDQLRSMLASNQQIITYTPIDDKTIEHVSYVGKPFSQRKRKKSNSRMLEEHVPLYSI